MNEQQAERIAQALEGIERALTNAELRIEDDGRNGLARIVERQNRERGQR